VTAKKQGSVFLSERPQRVRAIGTHASYVLLVVCGNSSPAPGAFTKGTIWNHRRVRPGAGIGQGAGLPVLCQNSNPRQNPNSDVTAHQLPDPPLSSIDHPNIIYIGYDRPLTFSHSISRLVPHEDIRLRRGNHDCPPFRCAGIFRRHRSSAYKKIFPRPLERKSAVRWLPQRKWLA
jgi:hypothetical protein